MKRQLDRLKGKRLVTGDPNLMTKDEICINATPNGVEVKEIGTDGKIKDLAGSGVGSGTSVQFEYYRVKQHVFLDEVLGGVIAGDMWALRSSDGEIWETRVQIDSNNNNNTLRYNDVLKFLKTYSSNSVSYSNRDGYREIMNFKDVFLNNGVDYSFKSIVELVGIYTFDDYFELITDAKEIKSIEASITHKDPIVQILEGGN